VAAELVIVGAGPAGVSAALWARSRDLTAVLLEAGDQPGGQLHHVHFTPRELPGFEAGTGDVLAARYAQQLPDAGVAVRYRARAVALAGDGVALADGSRVEGAAVLIASGARRRRLDVPGEREFEDVGVSYSATRDRDKFRGKRMAVVGGGDAAYENALILAAADCDVTLLVRDEVPRARPEFRARVAAAPRIRVVPRVHVTSISGEDVVQAVYIDGEGGPRAVEVQGVVIKVGDVPNTEWLCDALALDQERYVVVDERYRTSRAGVWAAGDVIHSPLPSIAVAMGTAALAVADVRVTLKGAV